MGLTRVNGSVKPDKIFNTVADAKAVRNAAAGDVIQTIGYYSAGDGGGALYRVVGPATGTDDGGSYHNMTNVSGQLELIIENNELHSKVAGIIHDDSTDNTTQVGRFFDYLIANPTITGVLDSGTAWTDSVTKAAASGFRLRGKGTLKATGSNQLNLLKFTGIQGLVDIDEITIDANNKIARPLEIVRTGSTATTLGEVVIGSGFKVLNVKNNSPDTFTCAGVYVNGGFKRFYFDGEVDTVDDDRTSGGVTIGVWSGWSATATDDWVRHFILGPNTRIKNVKNSNSPLADADGVQATAPTDKLAALTVVPGAYFENCKGRSIKSQVVQNRINAPHILRDAYDGLVEINLQYAGGYVRGATTTYNGFTAPNVIGVSQRDTPANTQCSISENELTVTGSPATNVTSMVALDVTAAAVKNQGITIRDNKAKGGGLDYMVSARVANTVDVNRMIIDGNWAETIATAFLRTTLFGASRAQLSVVFTNNGCENGCTGASITDDLIVEYERSNYGITSLLSNPFNVTIATGAITVYGSTHRVNTEASAATDDLDTINLPSGQGRSHDHWLTLIANNSARTVVLKDGTGNLVLNGDFSLDNTEDRIVLSYDSNSGNWVELFRSDNGA